MAPRPRKATVVVMATRKLIIMRAQGQGSHRLMRTTLRLNLPSIHAIRAVETALQAVEGIVHAEVWRAGVTIDHDGRATAELLREAVAAAGFDVVAIVEEGRRLPIKE